MRHLKLTGFIFFLLSLTESLALPTKPQDVDHFNATQKFINENVAYLTIIASAQYVQEASFEEVEMLVKVMLDYKDRCLADSTLPECSKIASQVMHHICSKQDSISSKIKACCEKKPPERADCIINANKDDRPEDLSLRTPKFTDSENVCQERDSEQDKFFAEFLYDYSRRHTELSTPELLRITKVYKDLLEDCCNRKNPLSCYRHAEDKFNETTERSLAMVQQECKQFQELGKDALQRHFLVKFTKAAPQLPMEELVSLSKEMVAALATCCTLSDEFACVDNLADLVLGELCGINKNRTINPTVDHCCRADFAFRRPCFEHLKADTTYALPSVSALVSALRADWCQPLKEDLQNKRHRFLVNLVKWMPEITDEERLCLFTKFTAAGEECGNIQKPEACFSPESSKTGDVSQDAEKQR
ncbi:afamin isoform X1 [Rattus norvegicus]|uniref:afamin isoform X1 n=1 Tax=Rattus norvegicus TaxID=10116 RepID=UPI001917279F|nr:afamin isoform X2 [Rattus norvegicus]